MSKIAFDVVSGINFSRKTFYREEAMLLRKECTKKLSIMFFLLVFSILTLSGTGMACRMYGVISDNLPDGLLQSHLISEPNSLKNLAQSGNVDGWGIAYYPAYGDAATLERGAEKAYTDTDYDAVVGQINSSEPKITIAHIRNCTAGCCSHGTETIADPHPFYRDRNGKTWTFMHNGGVSKTLLYDLIDDDDYLNENAPYGSGVGTCTTSDPYDALVVDSELYFLYILKKIEEYNWNAVKGIVDAVTTLIDSGESGMNFIMSDGNIIWAFRRGELSSHTLYYLDESATGYVAVASQYPSSAQGNWQSIEHGELVVLSDEGAPVVIDVTTYTEDLLADSDFNASLDSIDLRGDTPDDQDWYESRGLEDYLLTLDESDIGGNSTKKAKLQASSSGNAYLSQEFNVPQTGTFSVQWDIYVEEIINTSSPDRAGWMLIGDDSDPTRQGPNSDDGERFVYMAFFKDGGGTTGTMDLVARDLDDEWSSFTTVASGLNIGQWYTIKVVCDLAADIYDVYVDGLYKATITSRHTKGSLTHISFAQWDDGAGTFFVDNVIESDIPSQSLLVDSNLTDSADSVELRDNTPGEQDWYESRGEDPGLLTLDENDIGGNITKKAKLAASASTNAYLSQEFNPSQTGTFTVQWDIYVDEILNIGDPDRAGFMLIGDDSDHTSGPNSANAERFVYMAFSKPGGGTDGTMDLVARDRDDGWTSFTTIASGLNLDQWYTITVTCDVEADTYAVYVDGVLMATVTSRNEKDSVTHISFAQWNDGAGTFYVDNVSEATPPPAPLILDSCFWVSADSDDLRAYSPPPGQHQDWYESRGQDPGLLTLDLNNIGGNNTEKAGLTASDSTNAYLSQEFNEPQTGTFTVQWDIYVDRILDISGDPDRAGFMLIGDDSVVGSGPNAANDERFVYMAFFKDGGGSDGTMDLVARDRDDGWTSFTTIASGLNLDQWYTITVTCDLDTDTYAVYVDGMLMATVTSRNEKAEVTHISFAQWNDGAGTFYVDNVMAGPEIPQAFFSATPTSGIMPLEVAFMDLSTGEISSWSWDFGDSETSDVQNPTHVYTNPGLYTVSLTVTNPAGTDIETKESYIEVLPIEIPNDNTGEDVEIEGDWKSSTMYPGYYGDNYLWAEAGDGSASVTWYFNVTYAGTYKVFAWWSAASGRASNAPYTINHAFGSTTVRVDQRINGGQWNELGEFYFEVGTYSVVLTNYADGVVIADGVKVEFVSDQIPPANADFSADVQTGQVPLTVQFTDLSTGSITGWLWDFGDEQSSTNQNPAHIYNNSGSYIVTLTVTGPQGTDVETKENYIVVSEVEIIVDNSDPDFSIVGSWPASTTTPGYYGTNYQYNNAGTGNDQAIWNFNTPRSGMYKVYAWWTDFNRLRPTNAPYTINHGLGSTTVRMNQRTNGSQWNKLGEFYFEEDSYSVVLTDDADGNPVADAVRIVFLNDLTPPPHPDFAADIRTGLSPLTVNFTDQSGGNITEWHWDFGDGGTSDEQNPIHIFVNDGEYTVSLAVSGPGGSDTETKEYFIVVSRDTIIIDNSDPDFSVVGSWPTSSYTPGYWGDNYQYNYAGAGNDQATWNIRINKSGTYRVSAWWSANSNRPSNAPFTITHAFGSQTVRINQKSNGHQWNELGEFYFEAGNNYTVVLTDDADGNPVADAIKYTFLYSEVPPCQADFSVDTRFGTPPMTVHFTDQSTSAITAWNWNFGDGETSSEQNPVHIYENNGIYTVTLTVHDPTGSDIETKESFIIVTDIEIIIDNADPEFSVLGSWPTSTGTSGYYGINYQYNNAGAGNDKAIWNLAIPRPGIYKVYGWWTDYNSRRPTNAPYTINHAFGSTTIRVDQKTNGSQWNELGEFYFEENNYSVVLSDDADGNPVADAVRVVLIEKEPPVDFSADVTLGLVPLTVNFTDQSVGDIIAWSWDFGDGGTSTERNPSHVYNERGIYTVTLTITDLEGTRSETKENYIIASDFEIIIDNSDPDFSIVGSWPASTTTPGYYGTNYQYNNAGTGNDQAIWNFNTPRSGMYKVYAWWTDFNRLRPTNAPYMVNHAFGSTTVRMNQQVNGSQWNELGDFYFEEDNYSVVLTDDADGNPVADAVKVFFISEDPPPPHAEFICDVEMGNAPLTVQFTDQSTGFINAWYWDFGDGGTSTEQNPTYTYTTPGVYPVILTVFNSNTEDTITKEHAIVVVGDEGIERIYAFFGYYTSKNELRNTLSMLEDIGAFQKGNLWIFWDQLNDKLYIIEIIEGLEGYDKWKQALKTENAHIIYAGHANYGSGHIFATGDEWGKQEIDDIEYIDDDRILNFSSKYFSLPIDSYRNSQAFPNWNPVFQDETVGVMPYTYNDPEFPGDPDNPGVPAFNYYITYQVPGDPMHYKLESLHRGPIERFAGCGKPAWYSPDGDLPDYNDSNERQHFITRSWGSGVRSHYSDRTILFRKDLEVSKEEFKYSRMFMRVCNSGFYYTDTYNRGIMFYTLADIRGGGGTAIYLSHYLLGSSDEQIYEALDASDPGVYDYYNFNEPPPEREPTFAVQWDVYVDNIFDDGNRDRGTLMLIGDDSGGTNGPNSTSSERYVFLAFWCPGGGGNNPGDTMSLIAREPGNDYNNSSAWREIASGFSFDTWHTIKVTCDLVSNTYDVYINDNLVGNDIAAYSSKDTITHISFAQWNDGAGTFYIDDVIPLLPDSTLIVDHDFNASLDSADLIADGSGRDWYESRNDVPGLLSLDIEDVGGNSTKKARFEGSLSGNAFLSQEFIPSQSK